MGEQEQSKEVVKRQFGQNAEKYVTSESHAKGSDLTLLVEWLHPRPDWVALDIATGGGHTAKALAPHVAHVVATDLTPRMLAKAAGHIKVEHPNVWYVVADAEALPFLDETFDVVTCRIAPHHFPDPEKFVREAARVLKPNGQFLLIDNVVPEDNRLAAFINKVEKTRDESHVRCLSMREWRKLFTASGMTEYRSSSRKKTYDFPVWVTRTTDNSEQIANTEKLLIDADQEIKKYFSIIIEQGNVVSLQVDEWMVLLKKTSENIDKD
jgi:ubiquinone/menaquinone biosynthesis C-methylase UbiE